MRKSKMWRMLTVAAVAASMTCGIAGVQSVSADDKKTLKVAMECGYAPYNWTQPDDSNGAVQISGSSDYAYGYDVMMAKKIADELGYEIIIRPKTIKKDKEDFYRLEYPKRAKDGDSE